MIEYQKIGSGAPILLIHGFPNNKECWQQVYPKLSDNHTVILINLPGAGDSKSLENYSLHAMALAVIQVLEVEKIEKIHLVGHSMGGYVAMEMMTIVPKMIRGITLVHSTGHDDSEAKKIERARCIQLIEKSEKGKTMFLKAMTNNLFEPSFAATHPHLLETVVHNGLSVSTHTLAGFYQSIKDRSCKVADMKLSTIPIQYILGKEDTATLFQTALTDCLHNNIINLKIYKDIGHMAFWECPDRLANDIIEFSDYLHQIAQN